MMSRKIYKLHPISAIINFLKGLKELIIPIGIILMSRFFNQSEGMDFWTDLLPLIIIGVPVLFYLISGIMKWLTFIYWFEDGELRVEYGLFIKKKRYIPFDRIQALNYKEGIFHQLLGLVLVTVETAGNTDGKPEVELTAVTKEAAMQVDEEMGISKRKARLIEEDVGLEAKNKINVEETGKLIHKMSNKDLLILASTSNSIGVVIAGIAAILAQFSEYIPYDWIYEEIRMFVQFGIIIVLFTIIICFLVAWLLSIAITFLSYYGFSVTEESGRIIVTRGLLEKKKLTIPLNRVQAIKIVENPLRQLLGLASVTVESAGGGAIGEKEKKMILFPLIKKQQLFPVLNELLPQFELDVTLTTPPKRARSFFFRMKLLWLIPVVGLCSYFYYPYGFLSILLIIPLILLGVWQFHTTGCAIKHNQLTIVYRIISKVTFLVEKKRLQVVVRKQSYFQNRRKLISIQGTVMSGITGATAKVSHLNEDDADLVLNWFEHEKKAKPVE